MHPCLDNHAPKLNKQSSVGDCEEELPSTDCQSTVGQQLTDRLPTDIFHCGTIQ